MENIGVVPANETVDIIVKTMNYGTNPLNVPISLTVTCVNDTEYEFTTSGAADIGPGEVFDAHFSWDVPYDGNYEYCITAESSAIGDTYDWNDENELTVTSGAFYGLA